VTARLWPSGYVTAWCLSPHPADHARCRLDHTVDLDVAGCHCPTCTLPSPAGSEADSSSPGPAANRQPACPIWGDGLTEQIAEMELSA
jgi:hypothetical protein